MEKLHFEIEIKASPEQVYQTFMHPEHYRDWTSAFNPISYYRGTWAVGSTMYFLGEDEQGQVGGMISEIRANEPNAFISLAHIGILHNGEEITSGEDVDSWKGSLEDYRFSPQEGGTLLQVAQDSLTPMTPGLQNTWNKALQRLKAICEGKG